MSIKYPALGFKHTTFRLQEVTSHTQPLRSAPTLLKLQMFQRFNAIVFLSDYLSFCSPLSFLTQNRIHRITFITCHSHLSHHAGQYDSPTHCYFYQMMMNNYLVKFYLNQHRNYCPLVFHMNYHHIHHLLRHNLLFGLIISINLLIFQRLFILFYMLYLIRHGIHHHQLARLLHLVHLYISRMLNKKSIMTLKYLLSFYNFK